MASEKDLMLDDQMLLVRKSHFLRIKVKRQIYAGLPSISIIVEDTTKKIQSFINEKRI